MEIQKDVLDWRFFNTDLKSSNLSWKIVEKVADMNQGKRIDLRPYMIENPYTVHEEDKLQKVLDVFRLMHLRHLPVLDNDNSNLIGIITRVDLFRFMGL
jgi:CBS domain-containing protein